MKLFIAGLATETNTFSPMPTGLADYVQVQGVNENQPSSMEAPLAVWSCLARERGWQVVESLRAYAPPSGITVRAVYETLRDEILGDLKRALPVDAVLLNLHGAMVADGYDDCEGDILSRVRALVGPNVPTAPDTALPVGAQSSFPLGCCALGIGHSTGYSQRRSRRIRVRSESGWIWGSGLRRGKALDSQEPLELRSHCGQRAWRQALIS